MSTAHPEPFCAVCHEADEVAALPKERVSAYFADDMAGTVQICHRHLDELAKRRPAFASGPPSA